MGPLDYGKAPERGSKSAARAPHGWTAYRLVKIGEDCAARGSAWDLGKRIGR